MQWLLRTPLGEAEVAPVELEAPLTIAEEVLVVLLLERARGSAAEGALMAQPAFRRCPLVQLVHVGWLARADPLSVVPLTVAHFPFVRGLLDLLAGAWLSMEMVKAQVAQTAPLTLMGQAQFAVGASFLDVVEAHGKRHLARFLIDAAVAWLALRRPMSELVSLDPESSLKDRSEARRQAAALWRLIGRLERWDLAHRATRFIDDGYVEAQAMVRDWERLGPHGFRAAESIVAQLEALPV
jgi:hypothetical protein